MRNDGGTLTCPTIHSKVDCWVRSFRIEGSMMAKAW